MSSLKINGSEDNLWGKPPAQRRKKHPQKFPARENEFPATRLMLGSKLPARRCREFRIKVPQYQRVGQINSDQIGQELKKFPANSLLAGNSNSGDWFAGTASTAKIYASAITSGSRREL
jgi:hypothetical protein